MTDTQLLALMAAILHLRMEQPVSRLAVERAEALLKAVKEFDVLPGQVKF